MPNGEHLQPTFTAEAQALVEAIGRAARASHLRQSELNLRRAERIFPAMTRNRDGLSGTVGASPLQMVLADHLNASATAAANCSRKPQMQKEAPAWDKRVNST